MFNPLVEKLRSGAVTLGMWITLESPSIGEAAVALQLDWVVVDMEHGHLDGGEVMNHVRVFRGGDTCVLVRVPSHEPSFIKRALDVGAHGVIVPLVRSRADVDAAMASARYPLQGLRGLGGERAVQWGLAKDRYLEVANEEILVIPLIETRDAVENIDDILAVEGLEAIFVGPADLSASYGYLGQWEGPGVAERILDIVDRATRARDRLWGDRPRHRRHEVARRTGLPPDRTRLGHGTHDQRSARTPIGDGCRVAHRRLVLRPRRRRPREGGVLMAEDPATKTSANDRAVGDLELLRRSLESLGAHASLLTKEQEHQLDELGYVILPDLLGADQVAALSRRFDELVAEEGDQAGIEVHQEAGTARLANLVNKGTVFDVCWNHPRLLASVAHIFDWRPFKLNSLNARAALPGQGHQRLHADSNPPEVAGEYQNSNSIWMLDDFTERNGADAHRPWIPPVGPPARRRHEQSDRPASRRDPPLGASRHLRDLQRPPLARRHEEHHGQAASLGDGWLCPPARRSTDRAARSTERGDTLTAERGAEVCARCVN